MPLLTTTPSREIAAVHGNRTIKPDPTFELDLSLHLRKRYSNGGLLEQYSRFAHGEGELDHLMRRAIWRALARKFGHCVQISPGVGFKHLETFEIGDGVFIGAQAYIQGRFDGITQIGDQTWIGPQAYLDARHLILGDHVGWGPGAKILGSSHSGIPIQKPIIETELGIRPVHVEAWADIGTGAILMPGVTIGKGSIIGAGAVVTHDVAPFSVAAGVPARFIRWRSEPQS